jgi:AcrR family transcriptional regulator
MTRLAKGRTTHLTREEIAAEAVRQFDAGADPSIRSLAHALSVAPSAIYHHVPSRGAIVEAAVELVWGEVEATGFELLPDPLEADPVEMLVVAALAARRVWIRHYRLVSAMPATPASSEFLNRALAMIASAFERLGLPGEGAGPAFHTYATFTLGSVLFATARLSADERLAAERAEEPDAVRFPEPPGDGLADAASEATRGSIDAIVDLSTADPERDEELFVDGLRRLIAGFTESGRS